MAFDAGVAVAIFGMPPLLAFTLGSLLQAVGPALLVPLLFNFQQQRRGTHEGVWGRVQHVAVCGRSCACMQQGVYCSAAYIVLQCAAASS